MVIRKLYTHVIETERYGQREDGSEYERFLVIFPEDVAKTMEEIVKKTDDSHARYWYAKLFNELPRNPVVFGGEK